MIEKSIAGKETEECKTRKEKQEIKKKKKKERQNSRMGRKSMGLKSPLKRKKENVFEANPTSRSKFNLHRELKFL